MLKPSMAGVVEDIYNPSICEVKSGELGIQELIYENPASKTEPICTYLVKGLHH